VPDRTAGAGQPHPLAAVDVVVFTIDDGELKALLIQLREGPFAGRWAFPGGLIGLAESPQAAATRELREKTGVTNVYLEQLYTFGDPRRDPTSRVVSIAYFALVPHRGRFLRPTSKYAGIGWFPVGRLPPLAYDHRRIARTALERLRAKLAYTNIVYSLLPRVFTLGEQQQVYEIILGRRLDRRNFRRKLLGLALLRRVPGVRRGAHRPAALYTFRHRRPVVTPIL
jgi:8-oxo-dGTP diphosphatase